MSDCEKQGVSIVSMHSPGLLYASKDDAHRKNAVAEGVVAAEVAEEMGAAVMVCHFQTEEQSEKSVTEMLDQLEGHSIKLLVGMATLRNLSGSFPMALQEWTVLLGTKMTCPAPATFSSPSTIC